MVFFCQVSSTWTAIWWMCTKIPTREASVEKEFGPEDWLLMCVVVLLFVVYITWAIFSIKVAYETNA